MKDDEIITLYLDHVIDLAEIQSILEDYAVFRLRDLGLLSEPAAITILTEYLNNRFKDCLSILFTQLLEDELDIIPDLWDYPELISESEMNSGLFDQFLGNNERPKNLWYRLYKAITQDLSMITTYFDSLTLREYEICAKKMTRFFAHIYLEEAW